MNLALHRAGLGLLAACTLGTAPAIAVAQQASGEWQWSVTPYVWLPTIDGTVNFDPPPDGGGAPEVSLGPVDWLELLNFALLVNVSAQKDRIELFTDFVYLALESDNESQILSVDRVISGPGGVVSIPVGAEVNIATNTELDGILWLLGAGYAYADTHSVFAGVQLLDMDVTADWSLTGGIDGPGGETVLDAQGSIGQDTQLWDGVVGLKGHFGLGDGNWGLPYRVDVGGGDSDLVWSATVSLSRQFDWGSLVFGYRHLEYDEGGDGLMQDFSFSGPGFGATFRF